MLRRLLTIFTLLTAAAVHAQSFGILVYGSGAWSPAVSTSSSNPVGNVSEQVRAYCYNTGLGQWVPADSSCFGGAASSGFPITIGSTSIAANSTTTSISGLTLVAPALGTPTALVLTNATGLPLTGLNSQAADTVVMNSTAGSAAPTATAMPTCTTGADLYNTTTHLWSCVSFPSSGFPITIGSTSIAANSTTTSIAGLTIDGVSPTTMGFVDFSSSGQTQLNAKAASNATLTLGSTTLTLGVTTTSVSGLTLVAPALGTPTALVLTNATGLPASSVLSGALVNGMTGTTQSASDNSTKLATTAYVDGKTRQWSCQPGLGDGLNAITAGTYLESTCMNTTGVTVTLTGLKCFSDNSGSSTMNAAGNTLGALLTGAVTCSTAFAAGTQSANVALTSGDYIKFTFVADGTSKQSTWVVQGTY